MQRFNPFTSNRITVGAELPTADSLVTAESANARENNAIKNGVILAFVTGIGGFVLGQHLGVSKRSK